MKGSGFQLEGPDTAVREFVRELFRARELTVMLARKDFFVRYRRASLGIVWAIGLPLIQAIVLSVVFTRVIRIDVGIPYVVFALAGLLPWTYFSTSLMIGSTSVVDGAGLANKIYFPRAVLPLTITIAGLYTLVPSLVVLVLAMALTGVSIGPNIILLIPATALLVGITTGLVLVTSAVHVYVRDLRFVVQALIQPWFYLTPVIYPLDRVPTALRAALLVNPVTGVVQLFRAVVVGVDAVPLFPALWWSIGGAVVLLGGGVKLQARFNRVFVDLM